MKTLTLALLLFSNLSAVSLIYISNDMGALKDLNDKYKQKLLIDDKRIYLIPQECKSERYFGGSSQGELKLVQQPIQTKEILVTQKVFEAKETKDIQDSLEVQKELALIEGTESKEFLEDDEGRGFGGASEVALDYSFQKMQAKKENFIQAKKQKPIIPNAKPYIFPSCILLNDGSGYTLSGIKDAKFYNKGNFSSALSKIQLFK